MSHGCLVEKPTTLELDLPGITMGICWMQTVYCATQTQCSHLPLNTKICFTLHMKNVDHTVYYGFFFTVYLWWRSH